MQIADFIFLYSEIWAIYATEIYANIEIVNPGKMSQGFIWFYKSYQVKGLVCLHSIATISYAHYGNFL